MILISIKSEHCINIFAYDKPIKKIEWRTKPLPIGRAAVYCTKGKEEVEIRTYYGIANGNVVGEIKIVNTVIYATVDEIPESVITAGCVSKEFLRAYSKGKPLYANFIDNPQLYGEPKELGEFVSRRILPKCGQCEEYECKLCHANGGKPLTRAPQSWQHIETPEWAKE